MTSFRLAIGLAVGVVILLAVGGTVNPTGSSLACPDWPTCFGSFFPEMTGGVLYEHSHRIVATLVGLLTIVLNVQIWRERSDRRLRLLGLGTLGLVIFQGVLGGVTVLMRLPTMVSTLHLATAYAFFAVVVYLCFELAPDRAPADAVKVEHPSRFLAGSVALAVYAQSLLGAFMRHTGAGRACVDLPFCGGEIWPAWGPSQLHMLHRGMGVVVAVLVVAAVFVELGRTRRLGRGLAHRAVLLAPWLVTIQFLLGLVTVSSGIGVVEAASHTTVAALLFIDWVVVYLALGPMVTPEPVLAEEPARAVAPRPALEGGGA